MPWPPSHAAASEQHRDASLDAGAKALTILEDRALLVRFTSSRPLAATLRNADHLDAGVLTRGKVLLAEEAAIRAVQLRGSAKGLPVALEGRCHVNLVGQDCPGVRSGVNFGFNSAIPDLAEGAFAAILLRLGHRRLAPREDIQTSARSRSI